MQCPWVTAPDKLLVAFNTERSAEGLQYNPTHEFYDASHVRWHSSRPGVKETAAL